jgi:hypothetical protein
VIQNRDDASADLSGWTLQDDAGYTYAFASGFDLGSGETVTVHTGSGGDGQHHVYWERSWPVWNNDGDTGYLYDEYGYYVTSKSY